MSRRIIIKEGTQFGDLTVKSYNEKTGLYICVCKCGNLRSVNGYYLRNGTAVACKECSKKMFKGPRIDFTGKKIGSVTVKAYLGKSKWLCECDCGKEIECSTTKLKNAPADFNCGCNLDSGNIETRYEEIMNADYKGLKIGDLTITEKVKQVCEDPLWRAECKCGSEVILTVYDIYYGSKRNCGCKDKPARQYGVDLSGEVFGAVKVLRDTGERRYSGYRVYECECECGEVFKCMSRDLLAGIVKDCGCGSGGDL